MYRGEGGKIQHAELRLGEGLVMFGQHDNAGWFGGLPPEPLASTVTIYVVIKDPDAYYRQAKSASANIVRELADQP